MNLHKIEELSVIAARLADTGGSATVAINKIVELINKELDADQPNAQAEELRALQVSSDIKQANLNLLATKVLDVFGAVESRYGASKEQVNDLKMLASGLRQEEQCATDATYNGCAAPVDPVAQVVENLRRARAEVLRLIELRKQTSNADEEVAEAHKEACFAASAFNEELIKVIDLSIK